MQFVGKEYGQGFMSKIESKIQEKVMSLLYCVFFSLLLALHSLVTCMHLPIFLLFTDEKVYIFLIKIYMRYLFQNIPLLLLF